MIKLVLILMLGLFLIVIIKQFLPEYSFLVRLCVIGTILFSLLSAAESLFQDIKFVTDAVPITGEYFLLLIKIVGITILTQVASDTCKDCGESALSSKADLIGKVAVIAVAFPIIQEMINLCVSFLYE